MLLKNATLAQNILLILSILGILLTIIYFVTKLIKKEKKQAITSDDIDSNTESFENVTGFLYHAFSLEGSIVFFAFASTFAFAISNFLSVILSIVLGVVIGAILTVVYAFALRTPIIEIGETAIVSVDIQKNKEGKIILNSDNSEITAISLGGSIKKGKSVVVVNIENNIAFVRKIH